MGTNLKLSELLQYERKKGNVIQFPNFNIFYEDKKLAEKKAKREQSNQYYQDTLKFSVLFILKNGGQNISGINFGNNNEKAIVFLPIARLELKDVKFDFNNHTADIYLVNI